MTSSISLAALKVHTLTNGATVCITSPGHGFKFSDGTVAEPQDATICEALTLTRSLRKVREVKGMALNEVSMTLSSEQQHLLGRLMTQADIVLVPFPVLSAMREQGIRGDYPNVVAFNATKETQRSAPQDKIVDVKNWSY